MALRRSRQQQRTRHSRITAAALRMGDPMDRRTKDGKARAERYEFMTDARQKFELWTEAVEPQKKREIDDLAFYDDQQWPEDVKKARAGRNAADGLPPIAARPCIVINKLREPVNHALSDVRDAELGIELTPADDFEGLGVVLDETEIKIREGLTRRIQRDSQAVNMRMWAAQRAFIAGQGYYGLMTRFAKASVKGTASATMFDRELFVTGWYNQSCVTLDPAHEQPDGSDAEGGFIGRWITWENYKTLYPHADARRNLISSLSDDDFVALGEDAPKWFKSEGKLRSVHVVDFFYTVKTARTLCQLPDGTAAWKDELAKGTEFVDEREVIDCVVKWAVLDGVNPEPLEETEWITPDIPIIKVVGEEIQPYDDQRRIEGLVRPGRGSQEGFNAMASKQVELVAQTTLPSNYTAAGQMEGFEKWWELSTTHNLPSIPYNFKDSEGNPVGAPTPINKQSPIEAVAMSLAMFDQAVQTTTRSHDPSFGKVDPSLRGNAKAYRAVIDQSKEGTSNLVDNLRRSIRREAEMINNGLYPVYGTRPGRIAKIVNGSGDPETVIIGVPYTMQGKKPKPVMVPNPDEAGQMMHAPMDHPTLPPNAQKFQLSEHANCNINITITRNKDTRRQEEFAMLSGIVEADPTQLSIIGDVMWKNSDSPGHEEIAERYRAVLAPPIQALLAAKDKGQQPLPPAVQQQLTDAQQMMQQAQQTIQQLEMKLQGKVVENQGRAAITETQQTHEDQRTAAEIQAGLTKAEIAATASMSNAQAKVDAENFRSYVDALETRLNHALDLHMAKFDKTHELMQGILDKAHEVGLAKLDHGHALAQQSQAAELAPEPAAPTGV